MKSFQFIGYCLLATSLTAQAPSPTVSNLPIQQAREKVQQLEKEITEALASMPVLPAKDQFESTADYRKRNQAWFDLEAQRVTPLRVALEQFKQQLYLDSSVKPEFVGYDADSELETIRIAGESCSFKIPAAAAKAMHDSWGGVSLAHSLTDDEVQTAGRQRTSAQTPPTDQAALV